MSETIISGAYDMHVHSGPDIMPRKGDFIDLAHHYADAGMAGYVIKSHYFTSSSWAKVANDKVPECQTFGSIVMNNSIGGMNPYAVDAVGRDGGKMCWFPTVDTVAAIKKTENPNEMKRRPFWLDVLLSIKEDGMALNPVRIFGEDGKVLPEVHDVLDVVKKYDMILATGHISPEEGQILVKAAYEDHRIRKIIMTHVDSELCFYDIPLQQELIKKYGVYVEHCSHSRVSGKVTDEVLIPMLKEIPMDHMIISTDGGQKKSDWPNEGLLEFCNWIVEEVRIPELELRKAIVENPKALLFG